MFNWKTRAMCSRQMRWATSATVLVLVGQLADVCVVAAEFEVRSPDGQIVAFLAHDASTGTLTYRVESGGQEIISASPIGVETNLADFRAGLEFVGDSRASIDETYTLPQGKVSTYRNHANELVLRFRKGERELHVRFRAYHDGIAFRFEILGDGDVEVLGENSGFHLAGNDLTYWGQEHPNSYGYETRLGRPIAGDRLSIPVLAQLADRNHYVLMAQAATNGNYIQPHLKRQGARFRFAFPLDQEEFGPVRTTLPFHSPWRMAIISPNDLGRIVESHLIENLNPPTDPALLNSDGSVKSWIRPGRVMWDFIAGDRDQPQMWIDATAEMGWEYYLADAGFANRWGGGEAVRDATSYAAARNVAVIGWAHTRDYDTPSKAAQNMRRFASWGLKGAKIDFFDHNTLSDEPRGWRDYEDTQPSLRMRDWILRLGIEHEFLLELHGNTIPTGERRQYPHLMTLEGVYGMEKRNQDVANDLSLPFLRNVMGPMSYTIIHFERSRGSHAYQLATSIVYEAGLMIYAEHGRTLLDWPGREMIQHVPSAWDEIKFIEGQPSSHVILARRKGQDWYIGGMTGSERTAEVSLDFLDPGRDYRALVFRDDTHTTMQREIHTVTNDKSMTIPMLINGGFAVHLSPAPSGAIE